MGCFSYCKHVTSVKPDKILPGQVYHFNPGLKMPYIVGYNDKIYKIENRRVVFYSEYKKIIPFNSHEWEFISDELDITLFDEPSLKTLRELGVISSYIIEDYILHITY